MFRDLISLPSIYLPRILSALINWMLLILMLRLFRAPTGNLPRSALLNSFPVFAYLVLESGIAFRFLWLLANRLRFFGGNIRILIDSSD